MKAFVTIIVVLALIVVGVGGYLGFIPGVSSIFGSDKPRDLGQKITLEDSKAIQLKTKVEIVELPKDTPVENSFQLVGKKDMSFSFDGKEATALVNNRPWKYYPFSNVQIRLNPDNTIETSGMVNMDKLFDYAKSLGYSAEDVKKAMDEYKIPRINMPFYAKGTADITYDHVTMNVQEVQAGRLSIPSSVIISNQDRITSFVQDVVGKINGFSAKSLRVEDQKFIFDGTLPEKESVVTN